MILIDAAKGFVTALNAMKANDIWLHVRHLLCRWHVYEAIKRHIIPLFKRAYAQGKQQEQLNAFINAFKDVVCAPTEERMRTFWHSLIEGGECRKFANDPFQVEDLIAMGTLNEQVALC